VKLKRPQTPFNFLPVWLKPRRKFEAFSETVCRLVDGKPRWIGGKFEQNPAGFPEADRMKVAAVDDGRYVQMLFPQVLALRLLRHVIGHSPGEMVHSAR